MSDTVEFECLQAYDTCITIPVSKLVPTDCHSVAAIVNRMSHLIEETLFLLHSNKQAEAGVQRLNDIWERLVCISLAAAPRTHEIGCAQLIILRLTRLYAPRQLAERYVTMTAFMPDEAIQQEAHRIFWNLVPS